MFAKGDDSPSVSQHHCATCDDKDSTSQITPSELDHKTNASYNGPAQRAFVKTESAQEGVLQTKPTQVPHASPTIQVVAPPSLSDVWDTENTDMPAPDQIREMPALIPVNTLATSSLQHRFV